MRPAAAGLSNTAAEHQHVNHPTVIHIHVIPVIHSRAEDDHRTTVSFMGGLGKFTRNSFDMSTRHAGNLFAPGRRVGFYVVIIIGAMAVIQTTIQPIISQHQIVNADDHPLATVRQIQAFHR
ncbi:Uncharacterised protein [Salmonella enterica subsp. enterica serovar Bovismorbificans]|nr:Uncharacterised protein [Salmonella enterica subsp. enterica serovar Bovismorbificans]